jgi:AcrR family transcriptional regulator
MVITLISRKESIIITAVEIIDQLGIQGLSTREIAHRQGISEGTLFRHFKSKSEIMLAVLDHYSKFDADITQTIRMNKLSPTEAIRYYINAYAEYYENYPAITALDQSYDILSNDRLLVNKVKDIFNNRLRFVRQMIRDAQQAGEIRSDADADGMTDIVTGAFRAITLRWRLQRKPFSLRDETIATLDTLLNAYRAS